MKTEYRTKRALYRMNRKSKYNPYLKSDLP